MRSYLEKLRGLREDNDLTQTQIADILGMRTPLRKITSTGGIEQRFRLN